MVLAKDIMKRALFQQCHAFALMTGCKIFIRVDDPNAESHKFQYYGSQHLVDEFQHINSAPRSRPGFVSVGNDNSPWQHAIRVDGESGCPILSPTQQCNRDTVTLNITAANDNIEPMTQRQKSTFDVVVNDTNIKEDLHEPDDNTFQDTDDLIKDVFGIENHIPKEADDDQNQCTKVSFGEQDDSGSTPGNSFVDHDQSQKEGQSSHQCESDICFNIKHEMPFVACQYQRSNSNSFETSNDSFTLKDTKPGQFHNIVNDANIEKQEQESTDGCVDQSTLSNHLTHMNDNNVQGMSDPRLQVNDPKLPDPMTQIIDPRLADIRAQFGENPGFIVAQTTEVITPGVAYQCVYCNQVFDSKLQLDRHEELNHRDNPNRPHICPECGESFKKIGNLKQHQKVHTGLKPFKCDICDRTFSRSSHLKGHRYTHQKETPYKCNVCGIYFTNPYNLKRHTLCHEGKRQHHCSMCGFTFYRRDQLLAHERCHMKKLKR